MKNKQKEPNEPGYDAFLNWSLSQSCNLNCEYCTTTKNRSNIRSIDIPSVMQVLENTRKTLLINFGVNGEPFFTPNFIELCVKITEKNYIVLHTNLVSDKVKKFSNEVNPKKVSAIVASAHIKALEKKELLDKYFDNFILLKKKGFNLIAFEVAYPPLLGEVEKYKRLFKKKGIELKFEAFKGKYNNKDYPSSYTKKELEIFGLDKPNNNPKIYYQHNKICNAGYNTGAIDSEGDVYPCEYVLYKMGNIYTGIEFRKNLVICPSKFCKCPTNAYFPDLLNKALKDTKSTAQKVNPLIKLIYWMRRKGRYWQKSNK